MTKKVWVMIGAVLAAAAAVIVACVVLTGGKNEAYRSILVYQVNGHATITRERVGVMKAYENLMLQSGDAVAVASGSSLRLKLDDDKYILAEQDTLMNIVAEGDAEDSKTYIDLQKGSVTSEIQNKLKEGATYEVNTPNSIMAVRGTIFRVDVELDADGNPNTKLTVLQGTVATKAVLADGTVSDEEVLVESGNELIIEGMPTSFEDLRVPEEIDYDSLPSIVTDYIEALKQGGTKMALNAAENDADKAAEDADKQEFGKQPEQNAEESQEQEAKLPKVQQSEEPEEQEAQQSDASEEQQENKSKKSEQPQKKPSEEEQSEQSEQHKSETPESTPQMTEQPESAPMPSETEQTKSEAQESEAESPSKPQEPASQTEPSSSQEPSGGGSGGSGGGSSEKTQYYTVKFLYNGATFGTQHVKKGEQASEPKLCPTPNGSWDFDFSTKINKNLEIQWKEQ